MNRARIRVLALVATVLSFALIAPGSAGAQEHSASRKLVRGLAGTTLGVLAIPGHVVKECREDGVLSGMTIGLARGVGDFVARELVGVYEVLSAPFEAPYGFEPILDPEFPWQLFGVAAADSPGLTNEVRKVPGATVTSRGDALVVTLGGGLLFSTGSSTPSAGATKSLSSLASVLRRHPELSVAVLGHTDSTGSAAGNDALSLARARAVAGELTRRGVDSGRVTARGLGSADPVASNDTAAGRRLNRRVEIELR